MCTDRQPHHRYDIHIDMMMMMFLGFFQKQKRGKKEQGSGKSVRSNGLSTKNDVVGLCIIVYIS